MGYPIVRYALFACVVMLVGHFLFQNAPKGSQEKLEQVAAVVFPSRSASMGYEAMRSDEVVIPLQWEGVWVTNVELNDLYDVKLIVDTGASSTALSADVAFDIGLSPDNRYKKVTMSTANGRSEAWIGEVRSLRLGAAEQRNIPVIVMENFGEDGRGGLLGLNFLNAFNWHIDQQAGTLILRSKS